MGFLLRAAFWLAIAAVILPPEARLGGDEQVELRNIDLESELHEAAYAAWVFSTQIFSACESNPELCGAAGKLWDTTAATVADLATDMQERSELPDETGPRNVEPLPQTPTKIQARVE